MGAPELEDEVMARDSGTHRVAIPSLLACVPHLSGGETDKAAWACSSVGGTRKDKEAGYLEAWEREWLK